VDLLRLRRDLPRLQDVTALVPERDSDLPCMLIDAKVQHSWFSFWVVGSKVSYFTLPTEGEPLLLNAAALSQIPKQIGGAALRAEYGGPKRAK
jgi:hypothetical protein